MIARFALAAICLLAHSAFAGETSERAKTTAEANDGQGAGTFRNPIRRCYGGSEDGKTVVRSADPADEAAHTTVKGCRLGGGAVARAPQSPTISAGRPVIA